LGAGKKRGGGEGELALQLGGGEKGKRERDRPSLSPKSSESRRWEKGTPMPAAKGKKEKGG